MTDLAATSGHHDGQPPVPGAAPTGLPWRLIGLVVALCALPALLLGSRIDSWAASALEAATSGVGTAGLVVGLLALDIALPVPSSVLATLAGQRLGFPGATVAVFAGLCLGNAGGYLAGRAAPSPVVERLFGARQLARTRSLVGSAPGAVALVLTRPVPILSEAAVVLAGVGHAPVAGAAAACGLANAGLAAVYAGLGSAARGPLTIPLALLGALGVPAFALGASALLAHPGRPGPGLSFQRRAT